MSFIEIPLGGVSEAVTVPEGTYDLRIEGCEEKTSVNTGRDMLMVMLHIENPPAGVENPATVFHYVNLPMEDDEPRTVQMMLLEIKRFLTVFGVPFEEHGFDSNDLPGAVGECFLIEEEYEGRIGNKLKPPRLEE
jgi:hypothetical protein